jgi:hypothetical protein
LPFALTAFILIYFDKSTHKFSGRDFSKKAMKFKINQKIIFTLLAITFALSNFACQNSSTTNTANPANAATKTNTSTNPVPDVKPPTMTDVPVGNAQTPSEAYRMLFAAVKSQDPTKIKSMLSKGSMGLAEMASGQQKKSIEEVVKNGFTETTFVENYPQMRDERVKGSFGAVEVWNESRKQWDDIPFVMEDGSWKAAFGDQFGGKWQSPGKGQAVIEQENANAQNPSQMINPMANSNTNTKITAPKKPDKSKTK